MRKDAQKNVDRIVQYFVDKNRAATIVIIAKRTNLSIRTVYKFVTLLRNQKKIVVHKVGKKRYYAWRDEV